MNKSKYIFFIIVALTTIIIWSTSLYLGDYLSRGHIRTQEAKSPLKPFRDAVQGDPQSIEARLALASALKEEAYTRRQGGLVMEAVKEYHKVLELDPKQSDALKAIAVLCLENGLIDKAEEYFVRYLEINPDDGLARTDYGLTLLALGKADEAKTELERALETAPESLEPRVALAFMAKREGEESIANDYIEQAKALAKNDDERKRIETLLGQQIKSPINDLIMFVGKHPVLGSKVKQVTQIEPELIRIELDHFPVDQMPEFARQSLEQRIQALLSSNPGLVIEFFDLEQQKLVLEFKIN